MARTHGEVTVVVPNWDEAVVIDIDHDTHVAAMRTRLAGQENADETDDASYRVSRTRVPQSLIDIKLFSPKAITPEMVSIGPFHRRMELLEFESCKLWFLNRLLSRKMRVDGADLLGDLFKAAKRLENSAKEFYDGEVLMSSSDFIEMMVLDGCFIIELFQLFDTVGDPISTKPWLIPIITRDLLKLENQLPFFVLEELFGVISTVAFEDTFLSSPEERKDTLLSKERKDTLLSKEGTLPLLAMKFFSLSLPGPNDEGLQSPIFECIAKGEHSHLLALFHNCFSVNAAPYQHQLSPFRLIPPFPTFPRLPPLPEQSKDHQVNLLRYFSVSIPIFCLSSTIFYCLGWSMAILRFLYNVLFYCLRWSVSILSRFLSPILPNSEVHCHPVLSIQSATQLRPSGVKFKPRKVANFLQINFTNRVLQIPPITINDLTITVFINCLAYEHVYNIDSTFSHYIAFLSCLMNSPRDVAFLCAQGIIASYSHNDHYISGLFNKLGEKVNYQGNISGHLEKEFRAIEAYYNSHWGTFMRTYFSTPWSFISVVSAVILLVLTGGQTVLAVLSYIHQGGNQQ